MMKKIKILTSMLSVIMIAQMFSFPVYAAEQKNNNVATLTEVRTTSEVNELKDIYAELYPDEYHYIEDYELNGVNDMDASEIEIIFNGSRKLDDTTYDLVVMSNGQVFTNYSKIIMMTRAGQTTASFTVGDLGHYNTFNITYTINSSGYDKINKCNSVTGAGFYLYPTNLSKKMSEDADGPAHYGYNNVSMNYDGSGVLYDIGVAVGNNKAKGISTISTGADMWLWAFLYAFFFS